MATETGTRFRLADRLWIAVALLHREHPERGDFTKDEIRARLHIAGLDEGIKQGSVSAHLKEHLVANVPPSSSKYRMLFATGPGHLRLFRPGDFTDEGRIQQRTPSKQVPKRDEIPHEYRPLMEWYEDWCRSFSEPIPGNYEDDPLIRLIGSGKHIWADEHADEYVENLRREDR